METTKAAEKKRVLLIEDDTDIREALVELLNMEGFSVQAANNGKEGLDSLLDGSAPPHLILVDLMMPVMDGHQFLKEKNSNAALKEIPTIVMSADSTFHKNPNIIAWANAVIKKPIDIDQFVEKLKKYSNH